MTPAAYIPARWQPHSPRRAPIRVVLVHTTQPGTPAPPEAILRHNIARSTAHYFQGVDRPASAHVVVDPWEIIECVKPGNEAVGAPGVNADGYHIELCGFAEWDAAEWGDALADQMLRLAGAWAAGICTAHGLPALFLSAEMLKSGAKGLSGHKQASDAYHPGGHWDPGNSFPWDHFLEYVRSEMDVPAAPTATVMGKAQTIAPYNAGDHWYVYAAEALAALGIETQMRGPALFLRASDLRSLGFNVSGDASGVEVTKP